MTSHLDQSRNEHEELSLLLPWYANQTLVGAEHERVREHLRACLVCRRELNAFKAPRLSEQWSSVGPAACIDVDESFNRLLSKLPIRADMPGGQSNIHRLPSKGTVGGAPARSVGTRQWAGWLALAATVLLALQIPGGSWLRPAADFRTLANPDQAESSMKGPVIRVAFRAELPRPQLESLLAEAGGLLVSGPDASGVFSVRALGDRIGSNAQGELVAKLKSLKEVLSVEPISEAGPQ